MPLDLAELRQRIEHAVAGIDHQMLVRVWQELYVTTVGIWNTCKVCRDTLSSGTNLSFMSAMVTHLQTHETPEALLTCPVLTNSGHMEHL